MVIYQIVCTNILQNLSQEANYLRVYILDISNVHVSTFDINVSTKRYRIKGITRLVNSHELFIPYNK